MVIPWLLLVLHAVLAALAVPVLAGVRRRVGARRRHEAALPPAGQPWHDLGRLWAKGAPVPPGTTGAFAAGPAVAAAAAVLALLLVPSFSVGTVAAPGADLVLLFALLAVPRAALELAATDGGMPPAGPGVRLGVWPVLLLVAMAALLLSGGTNLPAAAAAVRDGGAGARWGGVLAGAALFAVLGAEPDLPTRGFAGRHRALVHLADWTRTVAGLSVVAALALPFGLAPPGAGPDAWTVGAAFWVLKLGALGMAGAAVGTHPVLLPAGALLAVMAVVVAGAPVPA